jgi:hypothetical protein
MAIGPIHKGAFHRWLGKKPGTPITDADIAKGIAAGGHAAKMAEFAKAARGFKKGGKEKAAPKDHATRMYGKDSKAKRPSSSQAIPTKRLPK